VIQPIRLPAAATRRSRPASAFGDVTGLAAVPGRPRVDGEPLL